MRKDSEKRLLELGFDTNLIKKIDARSLNLSSLKPMNKYALLKAGFTNEEADIISTNTKREPIPQAVLEAILEKSGEVCCYCADGISTRPFHIHHMDEYHVSRNNDEDNLALVCPNDHDSTHDKKIPLEQQKATKKAWENLWSIAQEYKAKGVSFPFGAFEVIDYTVTGSITEIFSFGAPKGSVCLDLTKGILSQHCLETLKKQHKLILAGGSGSGKSTLAKGIAGHFKDAVVFKYVVSDKTSVEIAKEISHFLGLARKELVLIIDDANTKIKPDQIETVLKLSNEKQRIILVNTRNSFNGEGNLEQHFQNCVEHISWPLLREDVISTLIEHETEIVDYLNATGINNYNGDKIGYSTFDHRLNHVVEKYAETTDTVWQFIFMLGGGLIRISKICAELQSNDRFDLVVLYIAIKQISKVEEGSSVEEIIELYKRSSILKRQSPPSAEWVKEKLNELCINRILVDVRGRYKTVHREFAKSFIETVYLMNRTGCSELLDEVFKDFSRAREIMILWSWLKYGQANDYTKRWSRSLSIEQWQELANETFKHELGIVSILAQHLHTTTLPGHSKIAHEVFKDKANALADLINKGENGTLYYFNEISTTLQYHCKEVIKSLMAAVDETKFANLIKNSDIDMFNKLPWLFNSLAEGDIDWVINFKKNFTFSDFEKIILRNDKGRIYLVYDTIDFYRRYIGNLTRSEFKKCVGMIGLQIKRCDLDEINFPMLHQTALFELFYFPDDTIYILDSIDMSRVKIGFEQATPRHWESMLSICQLAEYAKPSFSKNFVDGLDIEKVVKNIEKHYESNLHEFRIVLYQLTYASIDVRKEYAKRMQPMVEKAMSGFPDKKDHEDILKAFYHLDETLGTETCAKLGKELPEKKNLTPHDLSAGKAEIEQLEKTGTDYLLSKLLIQKKEPDK